jgi:hypothetical protein
MRLEAWNKDLDLDVTYSSNCSRPIAINLKKTFNTHKKLLQYTQSVPLATEPGISLIILAPMKILQRNLNRSTFVVWEMWHNNMCWKWPPFASKLLQEFLLTCFYRFCFPISAKSKHSLLQSIPIHFPTILCEFTHYTTTHEQQPYCVGTLSQMTERSAERRVRQETGCLAGGPLLRVAKIGRTTDAHYRHIPLHFSHNERTPVQIWLQSLLVLELLKKCRVR